MDNKADFCIEIDFDKSSSNPQRIFQVTADLIGAFQEFDRAATRSIDAKIEPILMLEDVQIGSLKTWLSNVLKGIPDDALKDLSWKKLIGHYLIKTKYIVVKFLEGKTEISDGQEIIDVKHEIVKAAAETGVDKYPYYTPLNHQSLVKALSDITNAVQKLEPTDVAKFISDEGTATFNGIIYLSPAGLEDLLVRETFESTSTMILTVKKPDYLGESMWDFKHGNHPIKAKILSQEWLTSFKDRHVIIQPGDALKVKIKTIVKYGFDNSVVDTSYEIIEVIEIIRGSFGNAQGKLTGPDFQ